MFILKKSIFFSNCEYRISRFFHVQAGPCPGGYYCLTGTGASTTYPCPAGTYINGSAAISSSSCTPCLSGNYCPNNGTAVPIECPPVSEVS